MKEILRCLERAIAREIHHVLLNAPVDAQVDLRSLRHQKWVTLTQAAEALETDSAGLAEIERHTQPLRELTVRMALSEDWLAAAQHKIGASLGTTQDRRSFRSAHHV